MKKKSIIIKSSPEFKKMLSEIKMERVKTGKSRSFISDRRLTLAISRIPNIKKFMTDSEIKENE